MTERRIESGRMSVDLEYKIRDRQLAGANRFVLDRLRLGERVDSPDAMHLPLDLALAVVNEVLMLPAHSGFHLFALGRTVGWIAHAVEQYQTGALIRPRARYVGVLPRATGR